MNRFNDCYKKKFYEKGFVYKRKAYVRVINDVLQYFSLSCNSYHHTCDVEFSILPLCMDFSRYGWRIENYYLKKFDKYDSYLDTYWSYDCLSPQSINECLDNILLFLESYLFPCFDYSHDCINALDCVIKIEKVFYERQKRYLRLTSANENDVEDYNGGIKDLNYYRSSLYYLALKTKNYDLALKCRREQSKCYRDKLLCIEEIKRLEKGDYNYFIKLLKENELASKEYLIKEKILSPCSVV